MGKKKKPKQRDNLSGVNAELLKLYLMGAANPAHSNKLVSGAADVVDLHLDKTVTSKYSIDSTEALFLQMQQVEKSLDAAIAAGKFELRIVHGIGKGKLKSEIHKMLAKHADVVSFENDYHPRFGWGSTLVKLI